MWTSVEQCVPRAFYHTIEGGSQENMGCIHRRGHRWHGAKWRRAIKDRTLVNHIQFINPGVRAHEYCDTRTNNVGMRGHI